MTRMEPEANEKVESEVITSWLLSSSSLSPRTYLFPSLPRDAKTLDLACAVRRPTVSA